ncbi:helix-turn-helix domain-containing protein [Paraflavitalea soli]|uniref:Helix-turn-helix domain-containing protein n=1 Tax=Paraflavitalea soli TaxID=2315862 RepID=A0A3B7MFS8_9BACT|nr:helix-turn-helix domain-containing protein [Paraflavitalea soli]AXY73182.1 helix-turn-helix domain-containing protein [Paraflavitalea soli]
MKQVTIIIPQGRLNLSSIVGTYEVLMEANAYWQRIGNPALIDIRIAGFMTELQLDLGYFSVHPQNIRGIDKTDLLIIPSIFHDGADIVEKNTALIAWVRDQYKAGSEIASICTGAFFLAASGLLDGKSCSTHWCAADDFRRLYPGIDLHIDKLITVQQGIYTNGGGYSFLNLILFIIEKYFDRDTAIYCSKVFQIDIDRSSQSPFFIFQAQKNHNDEVIHKAQTFIEKNLSERISFEELASKLAISRRNFDRRFIKATGNTPVEYLQRVKIEVAKCSLEKGRKSIFEVMHEVGYSDDKAFREVFKKIAGLSPLDYRTKFSKESALT